MNLTFGSEKRTSTIRAAIFMWTGDGSISRVCCKEAFVNSALQEAGLPLLGSAERTQLPTAEDLVADRSAMIAKAAAEWEAHKNDREMFASKEVWVQDSLREAGHTLLNKWEIASLGRSDARGGMVLSVNSAAIDTSGRGNVIERAVKEWLSDKAVQLVIDLEAFVQDALNQAGLGKLTAQDRRTMAIEKNPAAKRVVTEAAATWDRDPTLQRLGTRDAYIDAALEDAGIGDIPKL